MPPTVLVVEDEPSIRSILATLLDDEGYLPQEASNGLEALEKVRAETPDLIVLDLLMPIMDGWTFLEQCRSVPGCNSVPIVVLSASHQVPTDERVRAFLKKPFDLDVLVRTVESLVDQNR